MADSTDRDLNAETDAWCTRAEQVVARDSDGCDESLAVVREGILLRRRWDRFDRDAIPRRGLLTLLADAQVVCQRRLADSNEAEAAASSGRVEQIAGRLAEDDAYLAELLDDHTLPAETVAFAVECFRDDVHWLGTLVALLDGNRGIDFTGRVLLEQESLQRMMETWTDREDAEASEDLQQSARRLRSTALARQAEALLAQPEPQDWQGWHRAWQVASRLAMRPRGVTAAELERAVEAYRTRAMEGWVQCLAELSPQRRHSVLRRVANELADVAGEALTFLEDLPLDEAVRTLEVLSEDAAACMKAAHQCDRPQSRPLRRRLHRWRKTLAGELQERQLTRRMEGLFGRIAVAMLERFILLLLLLFVGMLTVEWLYERNQWPGHMRVIEVCAWIDLGICMVFLSEFSLKVALAQRRGLYLRRNWITMLVPAIPFGFLVYVTHHPRMAEAAELFVLLRGLRYVLRFPQMMRWLRLARPIVRAARLAAFAMQASDRLIRRIAPLLNRNLVLFERAAIHVRQPPYRTALATLRERFRYRASEAAAGLPSSARTRLIRARIEDLTAMLSAPHLGQVAPAVEIQVSATREIPLEEMIARLLAATPAGVSERIGRTLAQSVARWCRAFDVFAVRRLPVVRDLVVAGRRSSPYGTTAEVANRIGSLARHLLDRVYWIADLYGTLTAPQLVDAIGDRMVRGTARPARRLLIIGIAFLAVTSLAGLLPFPELQVLTSQLERLIGTPLIVLGLLCLVPLCIGRWFRQIAGEATDFCSQVAEAQFIAATKQLKRRFAKQHHAVLYSRALAPEQEFVAYAPNDSEKAGEALTPTVSQREREDCDDPIRTAVELLFEDYLDGAPFHRGDTKTTTQLLGNLTLVSLRATRLQHGRRQRKRLRRLDLAGARASLRGPYLWFHFISRSLAQQTAKLVVDYNAHALPLDRAATADEAQICRHVEWLARRLDKPADQLNLAAEFRQRWDALADGANGRAGAKTCRHGRDFHGNDFTAIHFLSADDRLEANVRRRYGEEVGALMRRDRRDNLRRVFRTYPFHHWPKARRTFNPLAIHSRYLAGGRVLLLPPRMLWWTAKLTVWAVRLLGKFVRDVLHPTVDDLGAVEEPDPFAVAVRKIHRMRKPIFLECLCMRAEFDPEYLGVSLPGSKAYARQATTTPIEEDLAQIEADPGIRQGFRQLASNRRRQMLEFRSFLEQTDPVQHPPESLRAMALAYTVDYRHVRSRWEATRRLKQAFDEVLEHGPGSARSFRSRWCRWRQARRLDRLFSQPAFRHYDAAQRKICRRALCRRRGPLIGDLRRLTCGGAPVDPVEEAREALLAVARDPAIWTRQLVILRAVQTLSVLDLQTYCDLVAELGEYKVHAPEAAQPATTLSAPSQEADFA